jgi:hypothetical protein
METTEQLLSQECSLSGNYRTVPEPGMIIKWELQNSSWVRNAHTWFLFQVQVIGCVGQISGFSSLSSCHNTSSVDTAILQSRPHFGNWTVRENVDILMLKKEGLNLSSHCPVVSVHRCTHISFVLHSNCIIFIHYMAPEIIILNTIKQTNKNKLHGLSPQANYTDSATAVCRRSDCQLLRIKGATWSTWRIPTAVFSVF